MLNKALAYAIVDSGKKKKTVARLARLTPDELSRIIHGRRAANEAQRQRLSKVLGRSEGELFPPAPTEAEAAL